MSIMKTMTCHQLGGACDAPFRGGSFEEIAEQSRKHGMEMVQRGDAEHIRAMQEMKDLMQKPETMQAWLDDHRKTFQALPEDQ